MPRTGDLRELRRRCQARLRNIEIPRPFDLDAFCRTIEASRGRRLVLQPIHGLAGRTMGAWIAMSRPPLDVVIYEQDTTRLHQEHIVLHELSHMLCGHSPRATGADLAGQLFPDLKPEVVQGVLERQSYLSDEDLEAEVMATLIRERAGGGSGQNRPPTGAADPDLVRRMEAFAHGESPD